MISVDSGSTESDGSANGFASSGDSHIPSLRTAVTSTLSPYLPEFIGLRAFIVFAY